MKTLIVFGICAVAMFAGQAQAGVHVRVGYHDGPRYVDHRHYRNHYRPRHRYRHRYGHRYGYRHRSRGRDVAAGLIVGALIGSAFHNRSETVVERRRIIDRGRDPGREPVVLHHEESYLQRDAEGRCFWVEILEDGTRTRERLADEECR